VAPFLTHLVIGERLWEEMELPSRWPDHYGTFLFGCLAPDVDKFTEGLSQATTHFVAKDPAYAWVEQRSQRFLDEQAGILRAPFPEMGGDEQAFVAGYLCHVATDEVTGAYGQAIRHRVQGTNLPPAWVDAFLTTFDPRVWALARDPERIVTTLAGAAIPEGTLPFAPAGNLSIMHRLVWPQLRDGGGLEPYLDMVRRSRYWRQHGLVVDEPDDPEIEARLA
jgi:hypothetical protein